MTSTKSRTLAWWEILLPKIIYAYQLILEVNFLFDEVSAIWSLVV